MTLTLDAIASRLAGLEETLIYKLLDRAQFATNAEAYVPAKSGFAPVEASSLFELRLYHQEKLDAKFGRYLIPEERPFYLGLPKPRRLPPQGRWPFPLQDLETVNVTGAIREGYLGLLGQLCGTGDDGQWGSAVEHDVICLQALARRIHFGALFVGESKFNEDPDKFRRLVDTGDDDGLMAAITRAEVEERVLARVRAKVVAVQSVSDPGLRRLVEPELLVGCFRDVIIPLTKEGEIRFLHQRVLL
ncbi:MAG: chorismate mutase [Spirochaetales bacterium]